MRTLKDLVPETIRARVRRSSFWRRRYNKRYAGIIASHNKRLDLCAAQFAHWLHVTGNASLGGKVCLELGSGWLATHALICYLLGAKRVIATDIENVLQPRGISVAIREAVPYIIRDVLSPFEAHDRIRARIEQLRSIDVFSTDVLRSLGIDYIAPIDLARQRLNVPVDFIYSTSVLEHVPIEDIPLLLANVAVDLKPGGAMFHAIHLEDHRDIENAPFVFLAEDGNTFGREQQQTHGNRLRSSQWRRLFDEVPGLDVRYVFEFSRLDKDLPKMIDPAVVYVDERDLRVSHLGVYAIKKPDSTTASPAR